MKRNMYLLFCLSASIGLTSCSKIVEGVIENNPSVVFKAIEKSPKAFFDVVQKAQAQMQVEMKKDAEEVAKKNLEEEFSKPKNPVVDSGRAIFGNKNASLTIVEYSDFQCPFCVRAANTIEKILEVYGDKVRVLYKHLPFKPLARPAAEYYEAIAMQSVKKAKKFHDLVFENQSKLYNGGEKLLKKLARKAGANMAKLAKDKDSEKVANIIDSDIKEAKSFGIKGTPGFSVGGVMVRGAYPFEHFKKIIDRHLKK